MYLNETCVCLYVNKILLGVLFAWIICAIVTAASGFTDDKSSAQYRARTDARIFVLTEAEWFRFPYPGREVKDKGRPVANSSGLVTSCSVSIVSLRLPKY